MRIGIDMLAVQSPHHGHRGIGRYSGHLVSSLFARDDGHEYVLYVYQDLPTDRIPEAKNTTIRWVGTDFPHSINTVSQAIDRVVRLNPDDLDVFLVLSPFEHWRNYTPPKKPPGSTLRLASVVYDVIPFLFQNESAPSPTLNRFYRVLEDLRQYDALLAISESTQHDTQALLGLPDGQVTNISAATDPEFFKPSPHTPMPERSREILDRFGIQHPYVLNVGGMDERKNSFGLIDAFARLPEDVRKTHLLVLAFALAEEEVDLLHRHADECGVRESLVVTREVTDEELLTLYQQCEVFVFPSIYEGFGLPILEALSCGAPVVAGNNSSQVEVVGDAGLLTNVRDCNDIAEKLAQVLSNTELKRTFADRALGQSQRFRWEHTAQLAIEAMEKPSRVSQRRPSRLRADRGHHDKPRIAFFSPLPPRKSGVSDYSELLLHELQKVYRIDLYHDSGYVPEPALANADFRARDHRLFYRFAAQEDYHAVVYQMGNSRYHSYMYQVLLNVPGVVTLHDFCLAGFHLHYGHQLGGAKKYIQDELLRWYPDDAPKIESMIAAWPDDWGKTARDCAESGWYLNRRLVDASRYVVVHSPWCVRQVRQSDPDSVEKMVMIPHGIMPRDRSETQRKAIRERFHIPNDALVFASFGFIHPEKMSPEALDAFKVVADENPKAIFLFVGEDADGGIVRRHAASLGLQDRVHFLGRTSIEDFADLASIADVGVNLRRPPTNGETSGALLYLLCAGVATIVTDVATFSDYPDDAVLKAKWESEGQEGLTNLFLHLARDHQARKQLGDSAWNYVATYHEWSHVGRQYVEVIERCHREQNASREHSRRRPLSFSHLELASRPKL